MKAGKAFTTAICAILVAATGSLRALGQIAPPPHSPLTESSGDSQPPSSMVAVYPSQDTGGDDVGIGQPSYGPRWTASADFIILDRIGSVNQTLVETAPGSVRVKDLPGPLATEVFNADDFHQGFAGGPKIGVIRHGDDGYDLELSYFQIDGWSDFRRFGPTPNDWLVMVAPGGFVQEQDNKDKQLMVWDYSSRLYNAEFNVRWNPCARITMLAGFRWALLGEDLQGTLPPERSVPFWDTKTRNNFYGFQIGADGKLFEAGRFSIDGLVKAGIFDNNAVETAGVSIERVVYGESASTNHAAFLGEAGLQCKYEVTKRFVLEAGYEAMWLEGVALAPGQIQETQSQITRPFSVQAMGVNCNSGVFYHGATVGLEYSF